MKREDRPEGYRQMRPKTFPASNYSGNSQQMMLHEIRESLRNISQSRPSDALKVEAQGRSTNHKNPHHKALQEIRESLKPFKNAPEVNVQMLQELLAAGFEEVRSGSMFMNTLIFLFCVNTCWPGKHRSLVRRSFNIL